MKPGGFCVALALACCFVSLQAQQPSEGQEQPERFKFRSAVELINVTATVSDSNGRFVSGLEKDDFLVYEDDIAQTLTNFSADRVPVSLGLVLDTSGSMEGDKIQAARSALDRLLGGLSDTSDEFFLYQFDSTVRLVQDWTSDRRVLSRALGRVKTNGDTVLYDAVSEAVRMAAHGKNRKKAVVVISDGNDTTSLTRLTELRQVIRETEVLVYAIGIDQAEVLRPRGPVTQPPVFPPRVPRPFPIPQTFPPRRLWGDVGGWQSQVLQFPSQGRTNNRGDRVNDVALRDLTDDSGGRTEIVSGTRNLEAATISIADELTKQYYLGYHAPGKKDGRWHVIRVELRDGGYRVRARRGYVAS